MAATHVSYEAEGWGVGELWLEGDLLLQHELPRAAVAERGSGHELADRFRRWFAGEADDFLDVALDLDGATEFELALTRGAAAGSARRGRHLRRSSRRSRGARGRSGRRARSARGTASRSSCPCHRVVGADGIGSYGSLGVEYKRRLLELEGVAV